MTGRSDEKTGNGQTDRKKGTKERVHRVGTVTFGVVLILFGILFLLHLFFPVLEYRFIFRLWPVGADRYGDRGSGSPGCGAETVRL